MCLQDIKVHLNVFMGHKNVINTGPLLCVGKKKSVVRLLGRFVMGRTHSCT